MLIKPDELPGVLWLLRGGDPNPTDPDPDPAADPRDDE